MPKKTCTVFCQDECGTGTIWISTVEVTTDKNGNCLTGVIEEAAKEQCAADWGRDDIETIHLLGIADGNVSILYWDDLGD